MAHPTAGGCTRRIDRTAVRKAVALLAKAESTPFDAESLAFLEGTQRLLGRVLAPEVSVDLRTPEAARTVPAARPARVAAAAYAATSVPATRRLDVSL